MRRTSSWNWYSLRSARSKPSPREVLLWSPCSSPSSRRTTGSSSRRRMWSEICGTRCLQDRGRYGAHNLADKLIGGQAFRKRFIGRHQPVAKNIGCHIHHVGGQHIIAPAHVSERP